MHTPTLLRLVGILCVLLISAQQSCQFSVEFDGPAWETYIQAGDNAYAQVDYAEAEKQWLAALKEAEKFGPQDPRLATTLNNLGELYRIQRKCIPSAKVGQIRTES